MLDFETVFFGENRDDDFGDYATIKELQHRAEREQEKHAAFLARKKALKEAKQAKKAAAAAAKAAKEKAEKKAAKERSKILVVR